MSSDRPRVSVCILTYNHERYIEACLRSVLDQHTPFDFEVLVSDDASRDDTWGIVSDLAVRESRLRVVRRPENIGGTQNYIAIHSEARGDFVAQIDGDDMAAPGKLASQVALLEANPKLVACGHRMRLIDQHGEELRISFPRKLSPTFGVEKLIRVGMPIISSSLMYRRGLVEMVPWNGELFDWKFLYDLLDYGDIGFLPDPLGYYRVNPTSMTSILGRKMMIDHMVEFYLSRLSIDNGHRADFSAFALVTACVNLRHGSLSTPALRKLLRRTVSPSTIRPFFDAIVWMLQNRAAAMVR